MKKMMKKIALLAAAAVMMLGATKVSAQGQGGGRGNFDPEQMRQRMMDRMKEQLDIKDDAEGKLIMGKVEKVMEARREVARYGGGGFGGFGRGPGGPGGPGGGGQGGQGGGRRGGFGEPAPEQEALSKAIEAKASKEELKTAVEKYRAARKSAEEKLQAAQDDLKKVLSVKQEAAALMAGLVR